MVEEMVVKDALSEKMIEAGAQLIHLLDKRPEIKVNAALWLYLPESNGWRLILASPQTRQLGPKKMYETILSTLSTIAEQYPALSLTDISAVANDDDLINRLRRLPQAKHGLSDVRFSKGTIDGRFIEDAYIYRAN